MSNHKVDAILALVGAVQQEHWKSTWNETNSKSELLEELRTQLETLAVDADRYRYLRDSEEVRIYLTSFDSIRSMYSNLDFKIDALLKKGKENE